MKNKTDVIMLESPESLQEICLEFICANFEVLFKSAFLNHESPSTSGGGVAESVKLPSKNENVHLHADLLEQLMLKLGKKKKLSDHSMTLLDTSYTIFRCIKLYNASAVTNKGFSMLKQLKIPRLEVTNMTVTVNRLIDNLGKWTLQNLQSLNVSHSAKFSQSSFESMLSVTSLQSLNVSYTEFDTKCLERVVDGLPHLKALDISCTCVDDISSLYKCRDHLTSLCIYALKVKEDVVPVLKEMHELRELDCSRDTNSFYCNFSSFANDMPNLISVDVSGQNGLNGLDLVNFLETHPKMCFLGSLMGTMCYEEFLTNSTHPYYKPNLKVTGLATERQILEGLQRYKNRVTYSVECLHSLAQREYSNADGILRDLFKGILSVMEASPFSNVVQIAAGNCLLKMTKGSLIEYIHPDLLSQAVNLVLTSMENNNTFGQIQRNSLQFLCKERILEDIRFDRYRCAHIVAQNLVSISNQSIIRTCITILSYLVRKMTTTENYKIGSYPRFMSRQLSLIRSMLKTYKVDQTAKLTLCTLWSITDESPCTCHIFVKEGGIKLFMNVLKEFEEDRDIEESALGIFSNVVEVPELRPKLRVPDFVMTLRKLLHSGHMDVSYFSAMIISHLACDGDAAWNINTISRQQILQEMEAVVLKWNTPKEELVSYRTLQSFLPLLKCHNAHQIQLWAVWDLWHICSVNGKKYGLMMISTGVSDMIHQLHSNPAVNENIHRICSYILDILAKEHVTNDIL